MPNSSQLAVKTQWTLGLFNNLIKDIFRPIAMPGAAQTLASNTITLNPANGEGYYTVDTSGGGPVDTLITINGGSDGDIVYLLQANAARSVQLSAAGNILMPASWAGGLTLSATIPIGFRYNATLTKWIILSLFDPTAEFWKNNSGGSLSQGNVVTFDKSGVTFFKTTTIQGDKGVLGVVVDSQIGNGAWGWIGVGGRRKVLLNAAVTVGQALITSTVAGLAIPNGGAVQDGYIGYVVDATGSPSYCLAEIHPNTNRTGGQATYVRQLPFSGSLGGAGTVTSGSFQSDGNNRLLVLIVGDSASNATWSCTWNGQALTLLNSSAYSYFKIYYLLAPAVTSATCSVTLTGGSVPANTVNACLFMFNDVNQSSPISDAGTATNTSSTPSISGSVIPGDYVLGAFQQDANNAVSARGAGQVNLVDQNSGSHHLVIDAISAATNNSQSWSWTMAGSAIWGAAAATIHPL